MFGREDTVKLRAKVAELEIALAGERADRIADRLDFMKRMEAMKEDLSRSISDLRGKRVDKPVVAFRNARDFQAAVEAEERIDAA
jgi:chlorite dismutase